ncbi:ATP-binding cassette domain-containing protein [Arthrobacter sp. lap29]|uniref:ATP-binding cassette domain-containing protein n=1 Tax=Arthrobacter sp. lap29 TaxID=3056122 RepID=UPI0028F712E8|nr:ATP-binding cassette domain-containing protein [Arthrobacter sp. lap29]
MQIHANNLALNAGRGPVYGPLTFDTNGGLTVLRGDPGSGRTALLLTLAGRMRPDSGSLTVGGHHLPRQLRAVQKISSVAGFVGIDSLEESVTVGAALRERLAWLAPWWSIVRSPNDVAVARLCSPIFGNEPIPHADTVIWDLAESQQFLLRLVLATLSAPELLLVDDIEQLRNTASRSIIWARLADLAASGTHVVVCASSFDDQLWADLGIAPALIDMNLQPADVNPRVENPAEVNPAEVNPPAVGPALLTMAAAASSEHLTAQSEPIKESH